MIFFDARVEKGCKSVYRIARKLQITVFALMSKTDKKKLYAKNIAEKYRKQDYVLWNAVSVPLPHVTLCYVILKK